MEKKFIRFYIEGFEFNKETLIARFKYSFDHDEYFIEEIIFKDDNFENIEPIGNDIQTLLFHLSIALGISYYKIFPTTEIIVESGNLSQNESLFWNKFYIYGLGEFFYTNNLSPIGLANFISTGNIKYPKIQRKNKHQKALVPIGGGKDSIVTIEELKKKPIHIDLFTFGKDNPIYDETAQISQKKRLFIQRTLSTRLFTLNQKSGTYNGHVPITGIMSFVLVVVAYLYKYDYIVFSNEHSSNFGNLDFHGLIVNHQYSKSFEFENDFRNYIQENVLEGVEYFSMMRPYYEVAIIKKFAQYKQYFPIFTSCNRNFHISGNKNVGKHWCLKCPKCAFVFACLHPHISNEEILNIFGKNMYEDATLIPLFRELAGISGHKPFECVGTNEEIIWSMHQSIKQLHRASLSVPMILADIEKSQAYVMSEDFFTKLSEKLFQKQENNIPILLL